MIDLDEKIMREMNRYLDGTTMEEILVRNKKMFHFQVMFTKEQMKQEIDVLDLNTRAYNCLRRNGLNTVGDVVNGVETRDGESSKRQLLRLRNLGKNTAEDILIHMFYYQFMVLPDDRKKPYMEKIAAINL